MIDKIGIVLNFVIFVPLIIIMIFFSYCMVFGLITDIDLITTYIQPFFQELLIQGSQQ